MATIVSINPANNQVIEQYTLLSDGEAEELLHHTNWAFQKWKSTDFATRADLMHKAAHILLENKHKYAQTICIEMGKSITAAVAEVEKCAWVCSYYADNAPNFLADEMIATEARQSYVAYLPLGIILAVMPWNFPFWQVFRFAAPALMAGNAAVLKHASNVPQCGQWIEEVFLLAGFPKNLFTNLLLSSKQVDKLIANPLIKAITLTGSDAAGRAVAAQAGRHLKKCVLELGGSDAYIVLEDADIDMAAKQCAESRLLNVGQSCIGAKRFIVVEKVYDAFLDKFIANMALYECGDPLSEPHKLAPMARIDLRDELHQQVLESVKMGAKIALGGVLPNRAGAYYPPTVLTNVKKDMSAYDQELFGPVASVIAVKNTEEAIAVANDSIFGLGACVFTENLALGEAIARNQIEAGSCFVNQFVKSDPRLPFGGIKTSGFGRELSAHGIREFVNIKTVYIA